MPASTYPVPLIGSEQIIFLPFSFEANEKGTIALGTLPYRCKIKSAKTVMQKAAGASDTGTVDIKKGSTTIATVTVGISAAIGDEDVAPSVNESVSFDTDEQITIVTTKSTAGGFGILSLTVEVLPSH